MPFLLLFNIVVLASLLVFLVCEEFRFRRFLRKVRETKSDLLSIVYKLRTPLANLRKYNDFLQEKQFGSLSLSQQEAVSKVQESLGDTVVLLDRMLARSHIDEAAVSVDSAPRVVRDELSGAAQAFSALIKKKRQTFAVKGSGAVKLKADPIVLHGIFDELLANAVHYTPEEGGITVVVSDGNRDVTVEIRDTGIGISASEAPHVFDKFFRGELARTMHDGSGLGLPFAKKFTETLGGTIRFVSKEGKGSTFTVTIPKPKSR